MNADPSRPTEATRGHFRAELNHLCDRFESADRRAKTSTATVDREAAEVERRQASADFWAAGEDLAALLLLLLRYTSAHQPEALRTYLAEALRPELEPLAEAIARLEARQ